MEQPDRYQQRYLEHQQRKRTVLVGLLQERHSERAFADKPLGPELHAEFASAYERSPSSCDRRGVTYTTVTDRDRLELLGGMLVGGVGWVHRAPVVLLLFADLTAYKAPGEATRMPYLDAGVIVGQ